jgi:hypothetical protein
MTPALVTELRRLEKATTPGPWSKVSDLPDYGVATTNQPDFHPDPIVTLNRQYRAPWRKNLGCNEADADFIAEMRNAAPALLEAVETMHAALERCGQLDCDSPIECQDKIIWRCHSCKAKDALARVAGLLGEGREKS